MNGSPWQKGKAFTEALNEQAQEWQRLKAAYPNYDFVVAGDFNQDLGAKHFYGSTHNKKFLDDTLNNLQLNCLTRGDIDPVQAQTCGKWQSIDHICVNSRLAGMARLPGVSWPQGLKPDNSLSDHFGTAVAFE